MTNISSSSNKVKLHSCLEHFGNSDVGKKRPENQDRFGYILKDNFKFFLVADGMGGVQGGALAAQTAIDTIKASFEKVVKVTTREIVKAISRANEAIFKLSIQDHSLAGMGTTIVGLCFTEDRVFIVNVGDSRAYRIRNGKSLQLTVDHTLVNELLKAGLIAEEQVKNHPVSHMLTRSLGPTNIVEVDCFVDEPGPVSQDVYLMCSDGLYNLVNDQEIGRIVAENNLENACQKLIDLANKRGGSDNITVVIVKVIGSGFEIATGRIEEDLLEANTNSSSANLEDEALFEKVILRSTGEYAPTFIHQKEDKSPYKRLRHILQQVAGVFGVVSAFYILMTIIYSDVNNIFPKVGLSGLKTEQEVSKTEINTSKLIDEEKDNTLSKKEREARLLAEINSIKDILLAFKEDDKKAEYLAKIPVIENSIVVNKKSIGDIDNEVVKETQNLAIWKERKTRAENIGSLGLSSELALISEEINKKQTEFQEATWSYLQLAEKSRLKSASKELQEQVENSLNARKNALKNLELTVFNIIQQNINTISNRISDLISKKAKADENIKLAKSELEILKALQSDDNNRVLEVKEKLKDKLESYYYELTGLRQLGDLVE